LDIISYLGLRLIAFLAAAFVMGFFPFVGGAVLHRDPVIAHLMGGTVYTLAVGGVSGLISIGSNLGALRGVQCLFDLCPSRASGGSGGSKDSGKVLLLVLAIVGLCILLWFILRGLYRLVCEARHEIVGAVRGANAQARRRVVHENVVLELDETAQTSRG